MTDETTIGEVLRLRKQRDDFKRFWHQASDERDAAHEKLTEQAEQLEQAHDLADRAWEWVEQYAEWAEAAEDALEEERKDREALIRLEVDRQTGREPKPRGRPPAWSEDSEAEVERMHREGASVRQIAADLPKGVGKSQVHRIITRVRRRQKEAEERARLVAIADGRSPAQRSARVAKQAAKRQPPQEYDPTRAERGREYLRRFRNEAEERAAAEHD
jgi:hypothetical protein